MTIKTIQNNNQSTTWLTPLQDSKSLLKNSDEGKAMLKSFLVASSVLFKNHNVDSETIKIVFVTFYDLLGDYQVEQVQEGFKTYTKEAKFYPTVADIIERIEKTKPAKSKDWAKKQLQALMEIKT